MDHIERAIDKVARKERTSLVEKAAEKLYGAAVGGSPAVTAEVPPPVAEPAPAPPTPPPSARTAPTTSKQVNIDLARLRQQHLLTPGSGRTQITEEFRLIKRVVLKKQMEAAGHNANLIMVTSALPGDGKSFTAINLAMSIASERDLRVLLVDGDFSNPSVLATLGVTAERGLLDVLEDESVDIADIMLRTNIDKLTLLPSGDLRETSAELLSSDRMRRVAEEIAQRYPDRIVIFDSPPILAASEPTALAQHVGQIVFVVRAEKTPRSTVKAALDLISFCPNIGLVLNSARRQFGGTHFGSRADGYYAYGKRNKGRKK